MTNEELILEQKALMTKMVSALSDRSNIRKVQVELLIRTDTETSATRLIWNKNEGDE